MTIEQERDIAVATLRAIAEYPKTLAFESSALSMRALAGSRLTEIAAFAAQASPVAQDEQAAWPNDPLFDAWWDADRLTQTNPYAADTPAFWSWEGWQARASVAVPAAPKRMFKNYVTATCMSHPDNEIGVVKLFYKSPSDAESAFDAICDAYDADPAAVAGIVASAQPVGDAVAEVRDGGLSGPAIAALVSWDKLPDGAKLYTAPPVAQDRDAVADLSLLVKRTGEQISNLYWAQGEDFYVASEVDAAMQAEGKK